MFEGFRSLRKFSIGGTNHKERIEHKKIIVLLCDFGVLCG
jgi:hypothetical protein